MPRCIIKLETPDGPRYLEYSSIVDAPVTWGMTLADFTAYYRDRYGSDGMLELPGRLARVEARGTSEVDCDLDGTLLCNRAGTDETQLSKEQIVDWYCVRMGNGPKPKGIE